MLDKAEYLSAEKVQVIKDAAPPTNVSELQSFLGSANFLRKFVPDFAKLASPLYGQNRNGTLLITSRLLNALILFYVTMILWLN